MDFKALLKDTPFLRKVANICLLVGGIDLGIYGLIGVDFITTILGVLLGRLIFIIIGVAAGFVIYDMIMGGGNDSAPQQPPQRPEEPRTPEDTGI